MVDLAKISREYFLSQELSISVTFIKRGLSIIQENNTSLEDYFASFLLLSNGIEKYLKVIHSLFNYGKEGKFLTVKKLKNFGHDLNKLKSVIIKNHYTNSLSKHEECKKDLNFLKNDFSLDNILILLSDFSNNDRYIFLNKIFEMKSNIYPDKRWEYIELNLLPPEKIFRVIVDKEDYNQDDLTNQLVIKIEYFLRAVTRTITLPDYSSKLEQIGSGKWDFLLISDDQLGTKSY